MASSSTSAYARVPHAPHHMDMWSSEHIHFSGKRVTAPPKMRA
ncbi:hypothetical protein A2U01_0105266, partial [Trifolium medium]|nr:hypothetical protein [Trifolium medium]